MSLLNGHAERAKKALDYYLSLESPMMRSRVYEIIHLSGLEPDDPMFLVLALTGQIRVFLEAAPEELGQLLSEWKQQNASSLSEIRTAVERVKQMQQEQAEVIRSNMETVSSVCVADIKEAGMATVGAIAQANNENFERAAKIEKQNEELKKEIIALHAQVKAERKQNTESIKAVADWAERTTRRQETVNQQITKSISEVGKIQQNKVWLRIADGLYCFPVLVIGISIIMGGTWWAASRKYNQPFNVFGRDLVDWNVDRLKNCFDTKNPKCTLWIVPPDSPQRQE